MMSQKVYLPLNQFALVNPQAGTHHQPASRDSLSQKSRLGGLLICHAAEHGVPIALTRGINEEGKYASILYGTYASANKEANLINTELSNQVQTWHVAVYPLEAVNALHNLWLSPVAVTPQVGRRLRLIFNFTWSGLNDISKGLSPIELMCFMVAF